MISLDSADKSYSNPRHQVRIFTIGFIIASPAGITKHVNIWTPNGRIHLAKVPVGLYFVGNSSCYLMDQIRIPCASHPNGLGKGGCPRQNSPGRFRNSMQGFIVILEMRDIQAFNCWHDAIQLSNFFFQRHPRNKIECPLFKRKTCIFISNILFFLTASDKNCQHENYQCKL